MFRSTWLRDANNGAVCHPIFQANIVFPGLQHGLWNLHRFIEGNILRIEITGGSGKCAGCQ
jgi:hypothetical protein